LHSVGYLGPRIVQNIIPRSCFGCKESARDFFSSLLEIKRAYRGRTLLGEPARELERWFGFIESSFEIHDSGATGLDVPDSPQYRLEPTSCFVTIPSEQTGRSAARSFSRPTVDEHFLGKSGSSFLWMADDRRCAIWVLAHAHIELNIILVSRKPPRCRSQELRRTLYWGRAWARRRTTA
jgi:hypothetical protein